jgi:flagellar motor switch protein FliM
MIARAGSVPLIVRSELVAAQMPASRLLNLRPGDVVPIPTPVAIPVTVAGRVFATASIGEWQGSAALRIESFSEGNGA